jgi:hypothetical protein
MTAEPLAAVASSLIEHETQYEAQEALFYK